VSALIDAINRRAPDYHTRLAMAMGALLETGSLDGPWGAGDGGVSYGPWQINTGPGGDPSVTRQRAENPDTAAEYIVGRYQSCSQNRDWSNPVKAGWETVVCAERPNIHQGYAAAGPDSQAAAQAFQTAVEALNGTQGTAGGGGIVDRVTRGAGDIVGGVAGRVAGGAIAASPFGPLAAIATGAFSRDAAIRVVLVLGGVMLCTVGALAFLSSTQAGQTAATAAAVA
jgi:hypothetical protein